VAGGGSLCAILRCACPLLSHKCVIWSYEFRRYWILSLGDGGRSALDNPNSSLVISIQCLDVEPSSDISAH
jgi:hypothetical protein